MNTDAWSTSAPDSAVASRVPAGVRKLLSEPLLHFIVLGAVLFGVDHIVSTRAGDPHTIVIDASVDAEAQKVFKDSRGRAPNAEELYALRRVWLDNEVLYREGLSMQLDKGDPAIRDRVIFKALSVIDAGTKLPRYDDTALRGWFERHREKYDEPARFDFQEAVLTGDTSEGSARAFADALNAGAPGNAKAGLRVFKDRPRQNLVVSYGPEFTHSLETATPGQWNALPANKGVRVIQLQSITQPKPASFENLRGVVLQDWTDATLSEQRSAAVRALTRKYKVVTESSPK